MKKIDCTTMALCKRLFIFFFISLCFIATANAQPYSAFTVSDGPIGGTGGSEANNFDGPPGTAIETGVKFRVSQGGYINGIRYYKGTSNTGTHTAHLFNISGGAAVATATSAAAGSGWTQINFATPYAVNSGTIYVATVYMPTGFYAATGGYFSGNVVNNGIELLCNCDLTSPNNGVFDYTTTGPLTTPPTNNFGGGNYWIDVSFTPFFPLPVGLSDLKATLVGKDVSINWKTASESNNRGFEIQRSNNGNDFYAINFVKGAGESSVSKSYNYLDQSLAPGVYYYRLKQTDFDGKGTLSSVLMITIAGKGQVSLFQNYPNPVSSSTTIRFDLPKAQHVKLSVLDMTGREVKVLTDKMSEPGSHMVTLDATTLRHQFYIVRLQTEEGTLTKKMLIE